MKHEPVTRHLVPPGLREDIEAEVCVIDGETWPCPARQEQLSLKAWAQSWHDLHEHPRNNTARWETCHRFECISLQKYFLVVVGEDVEP